MKITNCNHEIELSHFYGNYGRKAIVVKGESCFFVDFYLNDYMIDSRRIYGHTLRYAEDLAENYVDGIFNIEPSLWGLHDV